MIKSMRKRLKKRLIVTVLLIIGIAVLSFTIYSSMVYAPNNSGSDIKQTEQNNNSSKENEQKYPFIDLQPTIEQWESNQKGTASVVVYDVSNRRNAAELNTDTKYFAASIYKLYVTYFGYQEVAKGTYSMDDKYFGEWTRGKCL